MRLRHHRQEQFPIGEPGHEFDRDIGSTSGARDTRVGETIESFRVVPAAVVRLESRMNAETGVELSEQASGLGGPRVEGRVGSPCGDVNTRP